MRTQKQIAAGVLPICPKTGRILLVRRGHDQDQPGEWACFGGGFENDLDKSPKDTAKREFREESMYLGKYRMSKKPLHVQKTNHIDFYTFAGVFDEEFTPNIEVEGEAIDFGWFFPNETPESLLSGFKETLLKKLDIINDIICLFSKK
jgi:ADP-ribose pyrophosphatase YjhB (NUDIX family)